MTKRKIDYSKGFIYKLCCKDKTVSDIYIGSSTNFKARKNNHKQTCTNINIKNYNLKVYKFIRKNGNWNNWEMIKIEDYKAENKKDLSKRERYFYELLKASLNDCVPSRSEKEYQKIWESKNKDKRKLQKKIIWQKNKHKYNISVKCKCGGSYLKRFKERHYKTKRHIKFESK